MTEMTSAGGAGRHSRACWAMAQVWFFKLTRVAVDVGSAIRLVAWCVLVGFVGPLAAASPVVSDTGYEILPRILAPSMYWLDNSRLLFAGIKRSDMDAAIAAKDPNREKRLKKLYIWDDKDKSVRLYADTYVVELCYADGRISYITAIDYTAHKWSMREGDFGSERTIEKPWPLMTAVRSNITCKTYGSGDELVPPAPRYRHVVVLRDGDGYLDLGPGGGPNYFEERRAVTKNLVLYSGGTGRAISLPMTWDEDFYPTEVRYSGYKNAYVVLPHAPRGATVGLHVPWPKGEPLIVYLLWSDGRVEKVSFPYWPAEYLIDPHPFNGGWLFGGGKLRRTAGLHFFDGKKASTLDMGFVREIVVSKNGCRAAVAIQNRPDRMGTPVNVKVFDVCK